MSLLHEFLEPLLFVAELSDVHVPVTFRWSDLRVVWSSDVHVVVSLGYSAGLIELPSCVHVFI